MKAHLTQTVASSWFALVATSACQLVSIPVALSALDRADFALFAVITQILMAVMLAEFGARSACARLLIDAHAKSQDAYDRMWTASAFVFLIQAAVMLVLILGLAPFLAELFNVDPQRQDTAKYLFLVVGLINTINYVFSVFSTTLLAGQKQVQLNMLSAVAAIVQLVVFTAAIRAGAGLWAYPIGMIALMVCTQSMAISQVVKHQLMGKCSLSLLHWTELRTAFALGLDVFVAAIFSMVMGNSLLLFSGHLLTLEQTAVLAINLKLVTLMTQILQRIPGSAGPMLMKMVSDGNGAQFRLWWSFVTKATISISLLGAGMYVLWNELIITWWTSAEMVLPLSAACLLSLIPFRYLVHYQFVNSLTVFKEIRKVKIQLAWEILLYAGLAYVLGLRFGLLGLLSANLLSMPGGALLSGMKWMSVFAQIPVRRLASLLARLTLPLTAAFAAVLCARHFLPVPAVVTSVALSMMWVALFAAIGYQIILDDSERLHLKALLGNIRRRFQ